MITIEEIEAFCKTLVFPFIENVESEDDFVRVSMRDGVDDEPSQAVHIGARLVMDEIRSKFGADVKVCSEIVDEWIDISIYIK